jgi:hypothetical protein
MRGKYVLHERSSMINDGCSGEKEKRADKCKWRQKTIQ